ncbi:MAG TPA: AMP-binding protein [Bryobacteraceae bacterium]|jgi:long-chain acyl-CoA synthetase|nr:AMP-binding protein [Bryobacteraceae bacterium]
MPRETLLDFFADFDRLSGDFLVYDDGYRTWTRSYADTARAARAFAARLRLHAIRKGEKVVIWSENRPEWIAAFWGCLLEGVVVVPVDYRSSLDLLHRIAAIVAARAILTGDAVPPEVFAAPALHWKLDEFEWPAYDPIVPAPSISPPIEGIDIAQIVFTSGATAEPKGVIITHRNLLSNIVPVEKEVQKYRRYSRPFSPIRFLNLLPLSHLFGQSLATFIPPMIAGTVVFQRSYHPAEIVSQIRARRISVLVSVPKILEVLRDWILREYPETAIAPPPGMRWWRRWWRFRRVHSRFGWKFWAMIAGAAPLDPALEEFWNRLGFVVIQGYGLTETAPIVTLNHPFHARKGTVGTPIGGTEVRLADDGEVLVRGANVSQGYYDPTGAATSESTQLIDGWLHTGDIGEIDSEKRLVIRGRKKDMIVHPDGRKVFPEDVEAVLKEIPGVRDCAVVGPDQVRAVLLLAPGTSPEQIVEIANARLEDSQKIRAVSLWPGDELPRTPGTNKLKRAEIRRQIAEGSGAGGRSSAPAYGSVLDLLQRYAPDRVITPETTLDQLGLSSLDRVQLLIELEQRSESTIDEATFTAARTVADLSRPSPPTTAKEEPLQFPSWNRSRLVRWIRAAAQTIVLLPLTRIFARIAVTGLENLDGIQVPVVFAPNHQSHFDVPAILSALPWRWRSRVAPAMAKEFFDAHFHPERHTFGKRFTSGLQYYLATFFFNAFPLPQREAGTRAALRYMGDLAAHGYSVLIFPEGDRTYEGELHRFRPGVAMLAARARLPVVPVRIEGLERVLHRTARWPTRGPVRIAFGPPLHLDGDDPASDAQRLENAVRALGAEWGR